MTDLERGPSSDGESAMHTASLNKSPDPHSIVERLELHAVCIAPLGSKSGEERWEAARALREAATIISEMQVERDAHRLMSEKNYALWARERDARLAAESSLSRIQSETVEACAKVAETCPGTRCYAMGQYEYEIPPDGEKIATAIRSSLTNGGSGAEDGAAG